MSFSSSPWLLLACVLLAGAFGWWTYRTTTPALSVARRTSLGSLRFLALALVLFLLFEPLFTSESSVVEEPVLGLLVDRSQSMTFADSLDGHLSASDALRALDADTQGRQRRVFVFDEQIAATDSLDAVSFEGRASNLADALQEMEDALDGEPLGAIVLLSDGIHNAGANPARVAERYRVPIIAVAHGDSTIRRDLRIVQLVTNELAYAGTEVPVRVRLRNDGFSEQTVEISLSTGGASVDRTSVRIPEGSGEVVVDLRFRADTPGLARLQVDITRLDGEATWRNNTESMAVQVLDQRKQVLLVASAPSPDVSAWTQVLDADPDVDLVVRVQSGPGRYFGGALPDTVNAFDLLILVGFPGTATDPVDSRTLVDAVQDGLPVLFALDHATDFRMLQRDWANILPAVPETIRSTWQQVAFAPTPLALSHAIFETGSTRDAGIWQRLPPLRTSATTWATRPGADLLASSRIRSVVLEDPLFVTGRTGRARAAVLLAHGFWRWKNVPEDLADEASAWSEVRSNLLQWLYTADDQRLVRVEPSRMVFSEDEPVQLRGEVYDETLAPLDDARVTVRLRAPDGTELPVGMRPLGNGRYEGDFGVLPAGSYTYSAEAEFNGALMGSDEGEFVVGDRSIEFRQTRADHTLMRQVAARSGGQFLTSDQTASIGSVLSELASWQLSERVQTAQIRLWQRIPFLILVVLLLTVEWFFRKRFGLV
ncbi:MAG: VWA domain-containing protein [Rhodothermales bacterium]